MGRPRKSKEQLKLSGMDVAHPGRYAATMNTPDAILFSRLSCPVKYRPETKRAWDRIVPPLVSAGIVSEQDVDEINSMFKLFNAFIIADEHLEKVIEREAEYEDEFQFLTAFERWNGQRLKTWESCSRVMAKFGCTPADRAKIQMPEKKEESPIEQLLKRAAQ